MSTPVLPCPSIVPSVLTASEHFGVKLGADLVVLSARETGAGENRSGEGVKGLIWALVVAGSSSQAVSQWKVSDARARRTRCGPSTQGRPSSASVTGGRVLGFAAQTRRLRPPLEVPLIIEARARPVMSAA